MSSHLWRFTTQTSTNTNHAIARNTELFMLSLSQILINNQSYCGIKTNIPMTPESSANPKLKSPVEVKIGL